MSKVPGPTHARASRRSSIGFTLIELMIVVAIIGILAAVALPMYKRYTIHARMVEVLSVMTGDKTRLSNFRGENLRWPTAAEIAAEDVYVSTATDSKFLTTNTKVAEINAGNDLMLTYEVAVSSVSGQMTLTSAANDARVLWTCASTISAEYLPRTCR